MEFLREALRRGNRFVSAKQAGCSSDEAERQRALLARVGGGA